MSTTQTPAGASTSTLTLHPDTLPEAQASTENRESDLEKQPPASLEPEKPDIEHEPVADDPRDWSNSRRWLIVGVCSFGALIPTMAANIFFPALAELQRELNASDSLIALSVSLYILFQGACPLIWSPISEVVGRKPCFMVAMIIFTVAMVITSRAESMSVLIIFRIVGAMGSSANLAIAAGTIADMYEPAERGQKIGLYYAVPTLGPALSPIFGGLLTEAGSWRTTFYFVAACGGAAFLAYTFLMKDTFRTQRSFAWQLARKRALERAKAGDVGSHVSWTKQPASLLCKVRSAMTPCLRRKPADDSYVESAAEKESALSTARPRPPSPRPSMPFVAPSYHGPGVETIHAIASEELPRSQARAAFPGLKHVQTAPVNVAKTITGQSLSKVFSRPEKLNRVVTSDGREIKFKPRISDVSPLGSATYVLRQPHNIVTLLFSSLTFGSQYSLSYTASRTFAAAPYNFSPILIGAVLLALGAGGVVGSILGGRLSDRRLARWSATHDGQRAPPEERLKSVIWAVWLAPPAFVAYGWCAHYQVNIAWPVVSLVILSLGEFVLYSASLSYLVDSNTGRSSGAVACNSCSRGLVAFIASEVAGPLQDSIGDGWLYSIWAFLMVFSELSLLSVAYCGTDWRDEHWKWPTIRQWPGVLLGREREGGRRQIARARKEAEEERKRATSGEQTPEMPVA